MSTATVRRPAAGEHHERYGRYVALVPDGDVVTQLERQLDDTIALLRQFGEARAGHRYGPDKWSVREVIGHVIDCERVFVYRALSFARGEKQSLPGFDENEYAAAAGYDARTLESVTDELRRLRAATVGFFRGLDDAAWSRTGTANDHPISVRALAWIITGHELHHAKLLRERYL